MKIVLASALVVLLSAVPGAAAAPPLPNVPGHSPKLLIYRAAGAPNSCGAGCSHWIAVEGLVDGGAAARVRKFLRDVNDSQLPFYFHSPGGDLNQGLAIGRMLRSRAAVARVGISVASACAPAQQAEEACWKIKAKGEEVQAAIVTRKAFCHSACGYFFLGAAKREVAPDAAFAVHSSKIVIRFRGQPTERQRQEVMSRSRMKSDRDVAAFVRSMGISPDLVDLIKTVKFESSHILTRKELYQFGIDTRTFADTPWESDTSQRVAVRKFAVMSKDSGAAFNLMQWRLFCAGKDRVRINFIREVADEKGFSSFTMTGEGDKPIVFASPPRRSGKYQLWDASVTFDAVKNLAAAPVLKMREKRTLPDGSFQQNDRDIGTQGLAQGLTGLEASCSPLVVPQDTTVPITEPVPTAPPAVDIPTALPRPE